MLIIANIPHNLGEFGLCGFVTMYLFNNYANHSFISKFEHFNKTTITDNARPPCIQLAFNKSLCNQ